MNNKEEEIREWYRVSDKMPEEGDLCIVYFPVGIDNVVGERFGPIAMAYYRKDEGWIYADTPRPLVFKPYYWSLLSISRNLFAYLRKPREAQNAV